MVVIYYALAEIKNAQFMQTNYIFLTVENVPVLLAFLCLFAPAISGEGLLSQANNLKLMLHDRLIEENGKYILWKSVGIMSIE